MAVNFFSGVYPILDIDFCQQEGVTPTQVLQIWSAEKKIRFYQLRAKSYSQKEYQALYQQLQQEYSDLPIIINDHWQVAVAIGAFGLHLGKEDFRELPATAKEEVLAATRIRGTSSHSLADIQALDPKYWQYSGIGPIYPTKQKKDPHPCIGAGNLQSWQAQTPIPLVAIGGINSDNIGEIHQQGQFMIASISSFTKQSEMIKILGKVYY
ncbi:MAG: thiamine phosphate synthase [Spirochaetota bacterium]